MKTAFFLHAKKSVSFFAFVFFYASAFCELPADITFWSDFPNDILADAIVERMSYEELLAQIFMFGWAESEPSNLLNSWISERGLGGVKIFEWNADVRLVARFVKSLQEKSQKRKFKIPLFVATDQEGGWIRHIKGGTSSTPGNMAIGASGVPLDAYYSGFYINREIAALGFNMNFAPAVDLFTNKRSAIIGTRSFGEDAKAAGILGAAFAKGCRDAGVIAAAKHFPGHGGASFDSHKFLAATNVDEETFENRELVPFKYLVKAGVGAIMSGHLSFPKIRPNGEPASLSEFFLTEILRKELGFQGLIVTDDMMTEGGTNFAGSLSAEFRMAIEAGNDIILSSRTAEFDENLWTANLALMKSNEKFRTKVKGAARRVIFEKLKYFKDKNHAPLFPDENEIEQKIPDKNGQQFFFEQACRSITAYKKSGGGVQGRVLLCGSEEQFFASAKSRWKNASEFRFSFSMKQNEEEWAKENILQAAASCTSVIFCVSDRASARLAQTLKPLCVAGKRVVIFCVASPVLVLGMEWASDIFLGYSYSPYTLEALVGAAAGEFVPKGKLQM